MFMVEKIIVMGGWSTKYVAAVDDKSFPAEIIIKGTEKNFNIHYT